MNLATNKRAWHDFEILQEFEAGIVLHGHETKAAKAGQASLKGSHVAVVRNELFLINAAISRYEKAGHDPAYDQRRSRKLLVRREEIRRIVGQVSTQGLTLIPLSLYTKGQLVKLKFGLARHKKKYDKRESMKNRDAARHIARSLKDR